MKFMNQIFSLSHSAVEIDQLGEALGVKLELLQTVDKNKKVLLDEITSHGFRFIFFNMHTFGRIFEDHENAMKEIGELDLLRGFFSELQNELLHSILMSALGWPKYSIYTLRRCLELGFTAAFIVTSRNNYPDFDANPFLNLFERDLMPNLFYEPTIRPKDLENFEKTERERGKSRRQAKRYVRDHFTNIYLTEYYKIFCAEHELENHDRKNVGDLLRYDIPKTIDFECGESGCNRKGKYVVYDKVPSLELIRLLAESRLTDKYGNTGIDVKGLYDELCAYLHPNLRGHQHIQKFDSEDLNAYLSVLDRVLINLSWLLRGSIFQFGLIPQEEFRDYDIDIISSPMEIMKHTFCFEKDGKCLYSGKW